MMKIRKMITKKMKLMMMTFSTVLRKLENLLLMQMLLPIQIWLKKAKSPNLLLTYTSL